MLQQGRDRSIASLLLLFRRYIWPLSKQMFCLRPS